MYGSRDFRREGTRGRDGRDQLIGRRNVVYRAADIDRWNRIMLKSRILYINSYCLSDERDGNLSRERDSDDVCER